MQNAEVWSGSLVLWFIFSYWSLIVAPFRNVDAKSIVEVGLKQEFYFLFSFCCCCNETIEQMTNKKKQPSTWLWCGALLAVNSSKRVNDQKSLKVSFLSFLAVCIGLLKTSFWVVMDQVWLQIILNKVLLVGTKTSTYIGKPVVPNAAVHAVVEEQVTYFRFPILLSGLFISCS